jgi:hypothetical protein
MTIPDYATMEPLDKRRYLEAIFTNPAYVYATDTLKSTYTNSAVHDPSPTAREENRQKVLVMEDFVTLLQTEYQLTTDALAP